MSPRKKGAILSFVLSGNLEIPSLTGFELRTFRVTVRSLIHYTKFPNEIFLKFLRTNFHIYSQSFCALWQSRQSDRSTIGNFFWKDKKTRIINYFGSTSNFCMKFSECTVCESTQSTIFIIRFPMWKLFGKKVKYTTVCSALIKQIRN